MCLHECAVSGPLTRSASSPHPSHRPQPSTASGNPGGRLPVQVPHDWKPRRPNNQRLIPVASQLLCHRFESPSGLYTSDIRHAIGWTKSPSRIIPVAIHFYPELFMPNSTICLTFDFDAMSVWFGYKNVTPAMLYRGE